MEGRIEKRNERVHKKNVLYLQQRDYRTCDNYSLYFAHGLSEKTKTNLYVGTDLNAIKKNEIQEKFLIEGINELNDEYKKLNILYFIIDNVEVFIKEMEIDCIVTEFSPIKECVQYQNSLFEMLDKQNTTFYICDSHNLMPCSIVGPYLKNFRGLKSRFYKHWDQYFKTHSEIKPHKYNNCKITGLAKNINSQYFIVSDYKFKKINKKSQFIGGYKNAKNELKNFVTHHLKDYNKKREKPDGELLVNLGPWIYNGQIGIYTVLKEILDHEPMDSDNVERYINEFVMWRQTAEHFCHHEKNYDNIKGGLEWAQETLEKHKTDQRKKIMDDKNMQSATTDCNDWNAAQKELLITGEMHGYVRFYWAKKIMYWTETPEDAIKKSNMLINNYSFEAYHPIGYLNTMYSICGTMDRGWGEGDVRGKIRGMDSIKAKDYVNKWNKADLNF